MIRMSSLHRHHPRPLADRRGGGDPLSARRHVATACGLGCPGGATTARPAPLAAGPLATAGLALIVVGWLWRPTTRWSRRRAPWRPPLPPRRDRRRGRPRLVLVRARRRTTTAPPRTTSTTTRSGSARWSPRPWPAAARAAPRAQDGRRRAVEGDPRRPESGTRVVRSGGRHGFVAWSACRHCASSSAPATRPGASPSTSSSPAPRRGTPACAAASTRRLGDRVPYEQAITDDLRPPSQADQPLGLTGHVLTAPAAPRNSPVASAGSRKDSPKPYGARGTGAAADGGDDGWTSGVAQERRAVRPAASAGVAAGSGGTASAAGALGGNWGDAGARASRPPPAVPGPAASQGVAGPLQGPSGTAQGAGAGRQFQGRRRPGAGGGVTPLWKRRRRRRRRRARGGRRRRGRRRLDAEVIRQRRQCVDHRARYVDDLPNRRPERWPGERQQDHAHRQRQQHGHRESDQPARAVMQVRLAGRRRADGRAVPSAG